MKQDVIHQLIVIITATLCLIVGLIMLTMSIGHVSERIQSKVLDTNKRLQAIEKALDSVKEQGGYYGVDIEWKEENYE